MTDIPLISFLDTSQDEGPLKASFFGPMLAVLAELAGGGAETELTVVAGVVTPTGFAHRIDTESDAATDTLNRAAQDNHPDGRLILLRGEDPTRVTTVAHGAGGAGEFLLRNAVPMVLDSTDKYLLLKRNGTVWEEILRVPATDTPSRVFKNLLINGDFQVDQRDETNVTDKEYLADRWTNERNTGTFNKTINVVDGAANSVRCTFTVANTRTVFYQVIEAAIAKQAIEDGFVSLSFDALSSGIANMRAAVIAWTGTADAPTDLVTAFNEGVAGTDPTLAANFVYENVPANLALTGAFQRFTIEGVAIDAANVKNIIVAFWNDDSDVAVNDYLEFRDVQLEAGDVATGMERRPFDVEFQRCQRYYRRHQFNTGFGADRYYNGWQSSTTQALAWETGFDQPMRVVPTVSRLGTDTEFVIIHQSGVSFTTQSTNVIVGAGFSPFGLHQITVDWSGAKGVAGDGVFIAGNADAAGVQYDAELT